VFSRKEQSSKEHKSPQALEAHGKLSIETNFTLDPGLPGAFRFTALPPGHDARALAALARKAGTYGVVHVAQDETRQAFLSEALGFFAPEITVHIFPAWDCLPYDRVSPKPQILAERVEFLSKFAANVTQGAQNYAIESGQNPLRPLSF
jgi:transcription-repair coupling factor (superfamily II helicase)